MSELHYFRQAAGLGAAVLPQSPQSWADAWHALRVELVGRKPASYSRDEWAHLMATLDRQHLLRVVRSVLGESTPPGTDLRWLARCRSPVAVWLPNNVSLLGPLLLVLASWSGAELWMKSGSAIADLLSDFVEAVDGRVPLKLRHERFDRADQKNAEWAGTAGVRIVFGSDHATRAILSLEHPTHSVGVAFGARSSVAWVEKSQATEKTIDSLCKAFALYGQAGCTSPRTVCLLDADWEEAARFRDALALRYEVLYSDQGHLHDASQNVMARQFAAALGWDARLLKQHRAVFALGTAQQPPVLEHQTLMIRAVSADEAVQLLPSDVQTLGLVSEHPESWYLRLAQTSVKRIVPLERMHVFGPVWDGIEFLRQCFEWVEVST